MRLLVMDGSVDAEVSKEGESESEGVVEGVGVRVGVGEYFTDFEDDGDKRPQLTYSPKRNSNSKLKPEPKGKVIYKRPTGHYARRVRTRPVA